MKPKTLLTAALLAFVAVSLVVLFVKESRHQTAVAAAPDTGKAAAEQSGVAVYYLHTSYRCTTCRKLEAYTAEAVTAGFPGALQSGDLVFRSLAVDQPANAHLVKHYQLYTKSVVLSEVRDGQEVRWKNLDRVWDLVGDKEAYLEYVRSEIAAFQEAS